MVTSVKREIVFEELNDLIPIVGAKRHKGQNGKIGVIGGSFEYTGAPYYCAAASLRGGGDLSHIFCTKENPHFRHERSSVFNFLPIKSYSPEVIVHPYLLSASESGNDVDESKIKSCIASVTKWYDPLHAIVIGPGLGKDNLISLCIEDLFANLKDLVTVCDADFVYYLAEKNKESLAEKVKKRSKVTVLTPNKTEFKRIWTFLKGDAQQTPEEHIKVEVNHLNNASSSIIEIPIDSPLVRDQVEIAKLLNNVNIIQKGEVDVITNGKEAFVVKTRGCLKRCGGQGDILAGLAALYCYWDYERQKANEISIGDEEFNLLKGCMMASYIARSAAAKAYEKLKYGLTTLMILEEVPAAINTFVDKGF